MRNFSKLLLAFIRMYPIQYHLLGWIIFRGLENIVGAVLNIDYYKQLPRYLAHLPLEIAYFYVVSFLVYRYPFSDKKDAYALPMQLGRLIITLLVFIIMNAPIWYHFAVSRPLVLNEIVNVRLSIGAGMFRGVYLLGYAFAYGFALRLFKAQKRNSRLLMKETKTKLLQSEVKRELVIAQNAYLQTRINPHLLMNSLNFVYNSVETYSEQAAELIDILSKIMRYALKEPEDDGKIALKEEWEQVEWLFRLQQIRFNKTFNIKKEISGNWEDIRIPPILLLTFIENIFKHGDVYQPENSIDIKLTESKGVLFFSTINKISHTKANMSTNIGIENAKVRLNALYGINNHTLKISSENNVFKLELFINFEVSKNNL